MAKKRKRSGHKGGQRSGARPSTAAATKPRAGDGSGDAEASSRKAVRKEEARRQRESLRKQMSRRKRMRQGGIVVAVLAVIGAIVFVSTTGGSNPTPGGPLPGMLTTKAPWPANSAQAEARLSAIGLPPLSASEGTVLHIHQHLDILVDGKPEPVPADIGISGGQFAPLHTHDSTGVIHVESPIDRTFTLGQFFDVWGVRLNANCIGGYCEDGNKTLTAYVNGRPVPGDPADIKLEQHEEIVLAYGTSSELPNPIPSTFSFPQGT